MVTSAPYVVFPRSIGRFPAPPMRRLLPPTGQPRATFLIVTPGPAGQLAGVQVQGGGFPTIGSADAFQPYLVVAGEGVLAPGEPITGAALADLQAGPPSGAVPGLVQMLWIAPPLESASAVGFSLGGPGALSKAVPGAWYTITLALDTLLGRHILVRLPPIGCPY